MLLTTLTAISPLDGRYGNKTKQLRTIVSEYALIFYRLKIEIAWLIQLTEQPEINEAATLTKDERAFLENILHAFDETKAHQIKTIEQKTNHDVKAVEYYLRDQLITHATLKRLSPFIHFACTSEDINNLAYALMLKKSRDEIIIPSMEKLIHTLHQQAIEMAEFAMLSRTHGQSATPTTLGKEFKNFAMRLQKQLELLRTIPITGKCNGAVGNYNAHAVVYPDINWQTVSKQFVESLGLTWNAYTTQIEPHDFLAQFFNILNSCHIILIDFCRDTWGYISLQYFTQKKAAHEVGSSTMPHKINPIDFENAEGNLGIAIALATHLSQKLPISRWQRDLTDSTVLRNIGSVMGYALIAYQSLEKGLNKLIPNAALLKKELGDHWEILAEPIQTMMRRYGINNAYEQLKDFSRGEKVTPEQVHQLIEKLNIPGEAKKVLLALTPENYLGYAMELARETDIHHVTTR